ncbi:uncharacterized protein BX664DRAFT_291133 [Halteromyces radiatus]|uniref:uncharacterized protein n=1 Tax=Halteromyces radiatus TaxID=101107 RepID=UPI0022210633|nr:uncharacterized protein BX664DRAFT_291133 [Halteromyces radiatus]KAI8096321.1 hypothetical protein BX664DRAFT_291133 [Halteromyces radiatus]
MATNESPSSFVLIGGNERKIPLEQQYHPCPKCHHTASVQLTRSETQLVILNKTIRKPNNMRVRYECRECHWKDQNLPDE